MSKFKVGDRVRLVNLKTTYGSDYLTSDSNKVGNVGVIAGLRPKCWGDGVDAYGVLWDNGSSNEYWHDNLRKLSLDMRNK